MKRLRHLLLTTLVLVVAAAACQETDNQQATDTGNRPPPAAATTVTRATDNALFIALPGGKEQQITLEGKGFTHQVSPDNQWLCVDQALFSNLQVTRLYKRNEKGSFFLDTSGDLSKRGWQLFSEDTGTALEDVGNARSRCIGWHQDSSIVELGLTGVDANGEAIDTSVRIRLEY